LLSLVEEVAVPAIKLAAAVQEDSAQVHLYL
jgi:hypothetical protein